MQHWFSKQHKSCCYSFVSLCMLVVISMQMCDIATWPCGYHNVANVFFLDYALFAGVDQLI